MRPVSTETPPPLPAGLPARLATEHKITLFLDYDGTISEITPDVSNARPVPGAAKLIARLAARRDRFRVVLISGRQAQTLVRLLGEWPDITFVGNHGLEILEPGGGTRIAADPDKFMPALDAVGAWLLANVPPSAGFLIEDKHLSVALHYRLADPAAALFMRKRMEEFVGTQPALAIRPGKMVIEAIPFEANKGEAVRRMMREGGEGRLAVYFGDDLTDEDAFFALRETGVAVRVGAQPAASWARYCVASPAEVVAALAEMAAVAETPTSPF
jgi:trehalose 6-phosphate phosphatase